MSFSNWANSRAGNLKWFDIKLAQIASLCVGIIIGSYFSLMEYWWIFLVLAIITGLSPAYKAWLK